jgi:hypothetical protein
MRTAATLLFSIVFAGAVHATVENFDSVKPGGLPSGWVAGSFGKGNADWAVVRDDTAPSAPNVLKQSGAAKFCWCINTNLSVKNGRVQVRLKSLGGQEDQAGGLIWRFQDSENYYVVRADCQEDNVAIYKVVAGVSKEYGRTKMKVEPRQWHTLRVEFNGPHFTVAFDGEFALAWDDDTFTNAGPLGVWTKSDSVTLFDDFRWEDDGHGK